MSDSNDSPSSTTSSGSASNASSDALAATGLNPSASEAETAADNARAADPIAAAEMVRAGAIEVVPGDPPVPISVWRANDAGAASDQQDVGQRQAIGETRRQALVTDHGAPPQGRSEPSAGDVEDGLTSRLAALLVATFTLRGDIVVDLSGDPALAGAAGAAARRYVAPDDLAALTTLSSRGHLDGSVGLIVLRWPTPSTRPLYSPSRTSQAGRSSSIEVSGAGAMFDACAQLLAHDGCTLVVLRPVPTGRPYDEHTSAIIPAARRAGLGYLQHIVAVTNPMTDAPATRPAQDGTRVPPDSPTAVPGFPAHVDLLVFVLRGRRLSARADRIAQAHPGELDADWPREEPRRLASRKRRRREEQLRRRDLRDEGGDHG